MDASTRRPPAATVALVLGGLVALLGVVVLVGWFAGNETLTKVQPGWVSMQFNTALGFLWLGVALTCWALRRRGTAGLLGGATALLGLLTLLQYVFGIDIGIDELLKTHPHDPQASHPGRMAPNTALCFLLAGTALLLGAKGVLQKASEIVLPGLGAVVAALGCVALVGYVAGLDSAYGWGNLTRMAAHTSLGFMLAGAGLLAQAVASLTPTPRVLPAWVPLATLVGALTLSICLWQALDARETRMERRATARVVDAAADSLQRHLDARVLELLRMANRLAATSDPDLATWESDARRYLADLPGYRGIVWVDPALSPIRSVGLGADAARAVLAAVESKAGLTKLRRAYEAGTASFAMAAVGDDGSLVCFVPIPDPAREQGALIGVYDLRRLFDDAFEWVGDETDLRVRADTTLVYTRIPGAAAPRSWHRSVVGAIEEPGLELRLAAQPFSLAMDRKGISSAQIASGAGLLLSLLLAWTMRVARQSMLRRERAELASQQLAASALALERSRERVELALEASGTAAWTWELEGRTLTWDDRLARMLGKSATELGSLAALAEIAAPEAQIELSAALDEARRDRAPFEIEFVSRHPERGRRTLVLRGRERANSAGHVEALTGVCLDVTARVESERALRDMNERLERSNKELEQFAYVASHDLQEPLRMVASYTQLLARRYQGRLDEDADQFIEFAVDGARRMQVLIRDLLKFARVETRGQSFTSVDVGGLLTSVLQDLAVAIEESGAEITVDELPTVWADPTQLRQVFQNLLDNAIKYRGDAPCRIHVGVETAAKGWTFFVKDNGRGVEPGFQERIFVIFQRLQAREEGGGNGIGLALCRKIVARHGGRLWIESQGAKSGATFSFTLPKRSAA